MSEVVVLDGMPSAVAHYARALSPRSRPPVSAGLPDRVVNLLHHRCEVAEVAGYDRVCGFTLTDELPATWLHVLTFPLQLSLMTAPDFPLAPLGMVHVSNTMTQLRPVAITEPLELRVRAEGLRPHRRGVLVDLVGEALVAGEPVWTGRSTYLNRSASLADGPRQARPTETGAARPTQDPEGSRRARPTTESPELPTAGLWRLPSDLGRRYAAVSGDVNPIHLNPLAAKAFGLPRTIAHGMWTHARALAALQPRLPGSFEVSVQFTKPVLLPSTVRFAAARNDDRFAAQLTNRASDKVFLTLDLVAG
ncbi:MAG: MaoC/PaaZ C-terminal domain-containing protein [Micropruina sp.]|uniref:MaoC family dehydratase n=1 Tax=Micropruina sp. TaxID=2737536 RepID=UPI0039E28588